MNSRQTLQQIKHKLTQRLAPARQWYDGREPREQRVLQGLGIVLLFTLAYWLIWAPTVSARDQARDSYLANQQTLQWMQSNAPAVEAARRGQSSSTPRPGRDWVGNISRGADRFGLTLRGFTPEGDASVRIQLENQSAEQTVLWLQSLQQQGLVIASAEMSPGDAPGTSTVRVVIQR